MLYLTMANKFRNKYVKYLKPLSTIFTTFSLFLFW